MKLFKGNVRQEIHSTDSIKNNQLTPQVSSSVLSCMMADQNPIGQRQDAFDKAEDRMVANVVFQRKDLSKQYFSFPCGES